MKIRDKKELTIQISILILCTFTIAIQIKSNAKAQTSFCQSPLYTDRNPVTFSLKPNVPYQVKIDSAWDNMPEKNDIQIGVSKWNDWQFYNCSNITFYGFGSQTFTNYNANAPISTIYWQRKDPQNGYFGATFHGFDVEYRTISARIQIVPWITNNNSIFQYFGSHETGHLLGLGDCKVNEGCTVYPNTIMGSHSNSDSTFNEAGPSICDNNAVRTIYCPTPTPTPTPTPRQLCANPTPPDPNGFCPDGDIPQSNGLCCSTCGPGRNLKSQIGIKVENAYEDQSNRIPNCCATDEQINNCYNNGGQWDYTYCQCGASPIVLDVAGNGFNLTNNADGVRFNLNATGGKEQLSWTAAGSDDAWLVLDRNNNGTIDNGREMFGNFTLQPEPPAGAEKNGFLALAEFDKAANGGNEDGEITAADNVFASLRLWQDANHNGESEPDEMHALQNLNVMKLELDYHESRKQDENGNRFKYRAKIKDARNSKIGRWAWDVYLTSAP